MSSWSRARRISPFERYRYMTEPGMSVLSRNNQCPNSCTSNALYIIGSWVARSGERSLKIKRRINIVEDRRVARIGGRNCFPCGVRLVGNVDIVEDTRSVIGTVLP